MEWWTPDPDEPELFDWWRPLLAVAARVRALRLHWPVHLDEFGLAGRVPRPGRPDVWVYQHRRSRGEILADVDGRTYRFIEHRSGSSAGRFAEIETRIAVFHAGLHEVVDRVYSEPPHRADTWWEDPGSGDLDDDDDWAITGTEVERAAGRPRRGHLRLVSSSEK